MRKKTTSEIICENFKIQHETIFQDYKCTYRSSITFFGRLYVGEEHFLFNSNMFGIVKKCSIDVNNIVKIEQAGDSSYITIVQKVESGEVQYIFGNLKNNNAYKLMRAIWTGEKIGKQAFKPELDQQTEQFNKNQAVDPKLLIDEGQVQANFFNQQSGESQRQKIVDLVLPCTVKQFYDFFLSDKATVYNRKKHLDLRKSREIKVTEWKKSQELQSQVRQISAMIKVKGVPFKSEAGMNQVWMLKRKDDEQLQMNIVTQMSDVPYAAYFNCQEHITVSQEGEKKCKMNVLASIVFNKSTYMKNTIISRTFGDLKQQYEFWIKNTNNFLDHIRKRKDSSSIEDDGKQDLNGIEYEQNVPFSDKVIPVLEGQQQQHQQQKKKSLLMIDNLTLEQKVDLILKLLIVLLIINIGEMGIKIFH